jgi:ribosome maturation factor RimP
LTDRLNANDWIGRATDGHAGQTPTGGDEKPTVVDKVRDLAAPLCEAEDVELVHVEFQRERGGRLLRIYLDRPGGIQLDDCVRISRQLSDLLDVYIEQDTGPYNLEVSSPGLDRPLSKKSDLDRFKGASAKVRTCEPIQGQKNFTGILEGLAQDRIQLRIGDRTVAIPLDLVKKARLVNNHGE